MYLIKINQYQLDNKLSPFKKKLKVWTATDLILFQYYFSVLSWHNLKNFVSARKKHIFVHLWQNFFLINFPGKKYNTRHRESAVMDRGICLFWSMLFLLLCSLWPTYPVVISLNPQKASWNIVILFLIN